MGVRSGPLSHHPIVVADDEQFSRSIVARMLRDLGCPEALQAEDGRGALAFLAERGPRIPLAILDFNMPDVNGLQLLKLIRTGKAGVPTNFRVVLLTGSADQGLVGAALALDVDAFLVKPVSKAMLAARLDKVLAEDNEIKPTAHYERVDIDEVCRSLLSRKPVGQPLKSARTTTSRPNGMRLKLDEIPEGSILAEDIFGADRELLLGAGCVLSGRYLRRLKELSGVLKVDYLTVLPPKK